MVCNLDRNQLNALITAARTNQIANVRAALQPIYDDTTNQTLLGGDIPAILKRALDLLFL